MQKTILIFVAVALVGCGTTPEVVPQNNLEAAAAMEAVIRVAAGKPIGVLRKADYEKLELLIIDGNYMQRVNVWGETNERDLGPIPIHDNGLRRLSKLPKGLEKCTKLRRLYLRDNPLIDLKELENLPQLKSLDLSGNQLTDVKGLEKLTKLTNLSLGRNKLTSMKGLGNLPQLELLQLWFNQLTDVKGLENLTQLDSLGLSVNRLTDVKGLEKLTKLKGLGLKDNPDLTKAQIAELKKALPKCNIGHNAKK